MKDFCLNWLSSADANQIIAVFSFASGFVMLLLGMILKKKEVLKLAGLLLVLAIAFYSTNATVHVITVFIIATLITNLDFVVNMAAVFRGSAKDVFSYKIELLDRKQQEEKIVQEIRENEAAPQDGPPDTGDTEEDSSEVQEAESPSSEDPPEDQAAAGMGKAAASSSEDHVAKGAHKATSPPSEDPPAGRAAAGVQETVSPSSVERSAGKQAKAADGGLVSAKKSINEAVSEYIDLEALALDHIAMTYGPIDRYVRFRHEDATIEFDAIRTGEKLDKLFEVKLTASKSLLLNKIIPDFRERVQRYVTLSGKEAEAFLVVVSDRMYPHRETLTKSFISSFRDFKCHYVFLREGAV